MKRIVFFILFLSLLAFFENKGWFRLYHLKKIEASLQEENRQLKESNLSLRQEILNLKDRKYVEHYIRDVLGFIRVNELSYEQSP